MSFELRRRYRFEAAHRLPMVPPEHPCRSLHGHSYRVEVVVRGDLDPALGWVVDFAEIDSALGKLIDKLDHSYLNEIEGLENPTSENVARWLFERTSGALPGICTVAVGETEDSEAVYRDL